MPGGPGAAPLPQPEPIEVPPELSGFVWAVTADGGLLALDLSTGELQRWEIPPGVAVESLDRLAVLPEGVVAYSSDGPGAVAFPDEDRTPVVLAERSLLATALERVVGYDADGERFELVDGLGQPAGSVPLRSAEDLAELDSQPPFWVRGGEALYRDGARRDLATGRLTLADTGTGVLAATPGGIATTACLVLSCVLSSGPWDGPAVNETFTSGDFPAPTDADSFGGQLSPDGRFLVGVDAEARTGARAVISFDLASGNPLNVHPIGGFRHVTGFTDRNHVLLATGLEQGIVSLATVDRPTLPAEIDLGGPLLAVATEPIAEPTTGPRIDPRL